MKNFENAHVLSFLKLVILLKYSVFTMHGLDIIIQTNGYMVIRFDVFMCYL